MFRGCISAVFKATEDNSRPTRSFICSNVIKSTPQCVGMKNHYCNVKQVRLSVTTIVPVYPAAVGLLASPAALQRGCTHMRRPVLWCFKVSESMWQMGNKIQKRKGPNKSSLTGCLLSKFLWAYVGHRYSFYSSALRFQAFVRSVKVKREKKRWVKERRNWENCRGVFHSFIYICMCVMPFWDTWPNRPQGLIRMNL